MVWIVKGFISLSWGPNP